MKSILKTSLAPLLLALPLLLPLAVPSRAQENTPRAHNPNGDAGEHMDEPETEAQLQAFRHSPAVQSLARHIHLSTETTARIIEDLNSALLIGAILWFLFRFIPKLLRKRNETLQKQLLEARLQTAEASERLAIVEERLSKLGVEIEAIREQTERDSANDEKRIQESLEAERQRIVAVAEQEIDAAGAAAQRDLRKFAAQLAVDRARREIRISLEDDRELIRAFGDDLKGGRN